MWGVVETVLYDKRDRMAFVTLNRPAVKNAIDPRMHDELCRIWRDFRDDDEVDVAILSGAGGAPAPEPTCVPMCWTTTSMPRRAGFGPWWIGGSAG